MFRAERHRDTYGTWGGARWAPLFKRRHLEQLLYASAHAQWLPSVDPLLFPPALPQGKLWLEMRSNKALLHLKSHWILIYVDLHSLNTEELLFVFARWQIATEPPPLREIPCDCSSSTADVIKAGLQKDPVKRASARELAVKTAKALKEGNNKKSCNTYKCLNIKYYTIKNVINLFAVGGLRSATRGGPYKKPLGKPEKSDPVHSATPTTSHHATSSHNSKLQWMSSEQKRKESVGEQNHKQHKGKQWKHTEETRNDDHSPPKSLLHIQASSPEPRIINKTKPEQEMRRLEIGEQPITSDHAIVKWMQTWWA